MLSQMLKKLRENNGYTQKQIADALNIERSTYTYYETGKTRPDINAISKLSKLYNISYEELLESEGNIKESSKPLKDSGNDLYYTYDSKNFNHIYELSKQEKSFISLYRVLPKESQNIVLESLKKEVEKNSNNK